MMQHGRLWGRYNDLPTLLRHPSAGGGPSPDEGIKAAGDGFPPLRE
jgi:hypothetical protein